MAWDWGPTAGAFLGAAIPTAVTIWKRRDEDRSRRREQLRRDAEAVADAEVLLIDIDPMRRAFNLGNKDAEQKLWQELDRRVVQVRRDLHVMGAGHPSAAVGEIARRLATEVVNAANQCRWVVNDMLLNRDRDHMEVAQSDHAKATASSAELREAVHEEGRGL